MAFLSIRSLVVHSLRVSANSSTGNKEKASTKNGFQHAKVKEGRRRRRILATAKEEVEEEEEKTF